MAETKTKKEPINTLGAELYLQYNFIKYKDAKESGYNLFYKMDEKGNFSQYESSELEKLENEAMVWVPPIHKKDNDFIGFTFGGRHSSEFGIVRTSNGSRFDENLLPTIQDKTVQVPGGDGTYYFGSYYTQRQFSIPIAFDSLTEDGLRKLKQWLGDKKIKDLIFDEAPYKAYRAKVTGSATIKHICFSEMAYNKDGTEKGLQRIYKGEGTIQFTCYEPFARLRKEQGSNTKEFYSLEKYPTRDEWISGSGILTAEDMNNINVFNTETDTNTNITTTIAKIYNPGDLECDFTLTINFTTDRDGKKKISERKLWIDKTGDKESRSLTIGEIGQKGTDFSVKIDSKSNLLLGVDENGAMSGNTYNECITGGHFFKIPVCGKGEATFKIDGDSSDSTLEYRWLYF